ncbi:hypothetical protein BDW22DRAFT_1418455 [Trametopsis cervina]|nr:hypothetical protein BDW22DRAFT_1418455 [Trametopsis cervina]
MRRLPSGLEIASDVLFAPQNGHSYTRDDWTRCMAQQPILTRELPAYLYPNEAAKYNAEPPLLKYAWRVRPEHLVKVIMCHFPTKVTYFMGGDGTLFDDDHPEWQDSSKQLCPSLGALFDGWVKPAVCEKLELNGPEIVEFSTLWDQDAGEGYGFVIRNNIDGLLDEESIDKVRKFFNLEGQLEWYLDDREWYWRKINLKEPMILKELSSSPDSAPRAA